ncbi:MAG: DUF4249 family protein [bacterium]
MRVFAGFILCGLILPGCNNEFNPNGPYKQKLVVYGVFSSRTDTQYVRVYTTYPSPGLSAEAGVTDVRVTVAQDANTTEFRDTTIQIVNSSGVQVPLRLFVAYAFRPAPGVNYDLSVVSPTLGNVRSSAFGLYKGRMFTLSNPQGDIIVQVTPGVNVRAFIVRMYLVFSARVGSTWEIKRVEVPNLVTESGEFLYPKPVQSGLTTAGFAFQAYAALVTSLRSQYPAGVQPSRIVFVLTEFDEPLYAYYSTANGFPDSGTLRLDEPDYTNIQGGLGVFGMTSETVVEADTTGHP